MKDYLEILAYLLVMVVCVIGDLFRIVGMIAFFRYLYGCEMYTFEAYAFGWLIFITIASPFITPKKG